MSRMISWEIVLTKSSSSVASSPRYRSNNESCSNKRRAANPSSDSNSRIAARSPGEISSSSPIIGVLVASEAGIGGNVSTRRTR